MRFERPGYPLLHDIGPYVQILELGVASVWVDDERVLFDDSLFLLFFRLARLEPLLHVFDESKGGGQIGGRRRQLARLLGVGTAKG